jgi:glycosyltransferase involved in cell wall biosynthesis
MMPGKRSADLFEAARRLGAQGLNTVVILAGDGAQRGELERQGRDLKVPAVFLGFQNQSQLASVYRAADVLVLPSMSETWGLVVNEALACGTPCVVSDACGCAPDMIKPGINGAVFPVADAAGLADALAEVLAQNLPSNKVSASVQAYSVNAAAAGICQAANYLVGDKQGAPQ